ncbi:MAG: hypothetical protein PHU51_04985 [Candidatus Nanoarchaeia archaeon]|nr:hypothetical protein [Candidatus Nanoarchaeia archaeon]
MHFKNIFKPSKQFISTLGAETEGDLFIKYNVYPALAEYSKQDKEHLSKIVEISFYDIIHSTISNIGKYYKVPLYSPQGGVYQFDWISFFLNDAVYNAFDHSPKETPLIIASYLGEKALGMAFFDGGDFYKQPTIKRIFANKEPIHSTINTNIGLSGQNIGIQSIQKNPDFVEIDDQVGVLYCVLKKERLFLER